MKKKYKEIVVTIQINKEGVLAISGSSEGRDFESSAATIDIIGALEITKQALIARRWAVLPKEAHEKADK